MIENNAHIGAQIANMLTLIENSEETQFLENKTQSTHQESDEKSTVRLKSAPANKPVCKFYKVVNPAKKYSLQ